MTPTVCVVGLGYIGLPTAGILAGHGLAVTGVDLNQGVLDAIKTGRAPFVEPDLESLLSAAVAEGQLTVQLAPAPADVFIIAVPTPFNPDKSADLTYVDAAARSIAAQLTGNELIILESTSPPGTTQHLSEVVLAERPDLADAGLEFAYCPERVLPGRVLKELVDNDRIIGGLTPSAAERAAKLYRIFCRGELLRTDAVTAEMTKLVENSFRDVNIAFANELSVISDQLGIDVWELIKLANHHPRVNILQPGPGVGGHCIAVDPWFIVAAAPSSARLIRSAREVNDSKPTWVIDKVMAAAERHAEPVVALLGLAFKPDIDDLRESPALHIACELADRLPGARILVAEPHISALPQPLSGRANVTLSGTAEALAQADVVAVLVDHTAFKALDPAITSGKQVIDTRGLFRP